jgi:RNA polymerase sigma-70 factor (ECF subfamily)
VTTVENRDDSSTESLQGVLERIATGDRAAEAALLTRFQRGVRALVVRHCRPGDVVVDDIAQDVLSAVLVRVREGGIRDAQTFPAYLQTMIVRATTAEYRKRRARGESLPIDVADGLPDRSDPPADLDSQRMAAQLRNLIADLPVARDRALLSRFYLEEHSKEDICVSMGIADDHFHRVVHRARVRFRALLAQAGIVSLAGRDK